MVEVVGEEFELGIEVDVFGDGILELGHGAGAKLVAYFGEIGVENGVVFVQVVHAESTLFCQVVIVDDGDAACDGREVEREVFAGHPLDTDTQSDLFRSKELGGVLGGV